MLSTSQPILVTGATGFIASHVVKLLLERGYRVRGTVRSLSNKAKYEFLYKLAPEKNTNLELVEADLLNAASWQTAVDGVDYILHLASPFTIEAPKDENELIRPAVEGTTNVLEAALLKGVKKIVLTSSVVAVFYGHENKVSGPDDWSEESKCTAYAKSKTRAEKAAWDIWTKNPGKFELATVNPGFVLGPIYNSNSGASEQVIADFFTGKVPGIPRVQLTAVDVRDVAECHIRAMENPNSNGKRFICNADHLWMEEFVTILKDEFGKYKYKFPKMKLGKFMLKVGAIFDKKARSVLSDVNIERKVDSSLSVKELGMVYRSPKESLVDMGYSLIKNGVIPDKTKTEIKSK